MIQFNKDLVKNFKGEPWSVYGKDYPHLMIDLDDVDDADIVIELPRAVRFIDEALKSRDPHGAVFVHCVAGKSRSVSAIIAYLLTTHPDQFAPSDRPRRETASEAVDSALSLVRKTRPMAEPNPGFMEQLALFWEMGCPEDVESQPAYQRWAYKREVAEHLAVGQAPSRLRFEDEQTTAAAQANSGNIRCKKCRRVLANSTFVQPHVPKIPVPGPAGCGHLFIEPLSWMRPELAKADLNGRLTCPNERCGAAVGRYDWKGFKCACTEWVTPAFSLQKARVDEERAITPAAQRQAAPAGIRMPPGRGNGNL